MIALAALLFVASASAAVLYQSPVAIQQDQYYTGFMPAAPLVRNIENEDSLLVKNPFAQSAAPRSDILINNPVQSIQTSYGIPAALQYQSPVAQVRSEVISSPIYQQSYLAQPYVQTSMIAAAPLMARSDYAANTYSAPAATSTYSEQNNYGNKQTTYQSSGSAGYGAQAGYGGWQSVNSNYGNQAGYNGWQAAPAATTYTQQTNTYVQPAATYVQPAQQTYTQTYAAPAQSSYAVAAPAATYTQTYSPPAAVYSAPAAVYSAPATYTEKSYSVAAPAQTYAANTYSAPAATSTYSEQNNYGNKQVTYQGTGSTGYGAQAGYGGWQASNVGYGNQAGYGGWSAPAATTYTQTNTYAQPAATYVAAPATYTQQTYSAPAAVYSAPAASTTYTKETSYAPVQTYSAPVQTYTQTYSAPAAVYAAPAQATYTQQTYSAPAAVYSAPASYSTVKNTYAAPAAVYSVKAY